MVLLALAQLCIVGLACTMADGACGTFANQVKTRVRSRGAHGHSFEKCSLTWRRSQGRSSSAEGPIVGRPLGATWLELGSAHMETLNTQCGRSLERRRRPSLLPKDSSSATALAGLTTWRTSGLIANRPGAPSNHRRRLQLQRQSGQSTLVPSASVPKCCRSFPSAAKFGRSGWPRTEKV